MLLGIVPRVGAVYSQQSMDSQMVQNSISNIFITFKKHNHIQDNNFIKFNKYLKSVITFNRLNLLNSTKVNLISHSTERFGDQQ